jgi:broad specificity phosphatase PhoE
MSEASGGVDLGRQLSKSLPRSKRAPTRGVSTGRRLFLVRHGQTSLHADNVLGGHLDPQLDLAGLRQAMEVADAIARNGLKYVVCSPLTRAFDTAASIAARAGIDIEKDDRLIDRDYGSWAGKSKAEVIARWGSLDAAPGIEPVSEVLARAMSAVLDVTSRIKSGAAAVVTHEAVLQSVLPALDPALEQRQPIAQVPGCFNVVEQIGEGWQITRINVCPQTGWREPPEAAEQ